MTAAAPEGRGSPGGVRVLVATGLSSTLAVLPVSLLGALAPLMRAEAELGNVRLGAAVATFFAAAAVISIPTGRLPDRFGGGIVMTISTVACAATLPLLALAGDRPTALFLIMGLSGATNAIAQTAGTVTLAEHVTRRLRGLSFGVKLGAIPFAGLLAGLAVPALGVPLGWRPAMAAGALLLVPYFAAMRGVVSTRRRAGDAGRPQHSATLAWVFMGATAALGSAAGHSMQVFFVSSSVGRGVDAGTAGLLLALGGGVSMVGRILWSWVGARPGVSARLMLAALFALGGASFLGIGFAASFTALGAATVLAFATGWSWAGLHAYLVVESSPERPGAATGAVLTGVWLGGIAGPPLFGGLVEWHSFVAAWTTMGLFLVVGGLLALLHPSPSRPAQPRG